MSDLDLAALRAVAEAATPGPWKWKQVYQMAHRTYHWAICDPVNSKEGRVTDVLLVLLHDGRTFLDKPVRDYPNIQYTEAFDPTTALALLARAEEANTLEAERDALTKALNQRTWELDRCHASVADLPKVLSDAGIHDDRNYADMVREIVAERDRLREQVARMTEAMGSEWDDGISADEKPRCRECRVTKATGHTSRCSRGRFFAVSKEVQT